MLHNLRAAVAVVLCLAGAGTALAQSPQASSTVRVDYSQPANWLCRPGRKDACDVDLDATVVAVDGSTRIDRYRPNPAPPIDCFYVYPTVSLDPGVDATMKIGPEERLIVRRQFARFGAVCRLFAPEYRQHTLTALVAEMDKKRSPDGDPATPYEDVLNAWREYLAHDNHGRGVVLIGHSQGSFILTQLVAQEIDGKPVQKRLVSVILAGTSLQTPPGRDAGGDFKHIPLCHAAGETGCVITFASFRATSPPPATSYFGQGDPKAGTVAACVNPAALAGGSGPLRAFMQTEGPWLMRGSLREIAGGARPNWTQPPEPIKTPFVELPGLLSARCESNAHGNYLAIFVHPTPGGRRVNDIPGDIVMNGEAQPNWGLHLIDVDLTIGDLIGDVRAETRTYLAKTAR